MILKESELCACFMARTRRLGWTCSPETSGWDVLCERELDGFQVGVQAKLRTNLKVLCQALQPVEGRDGPDVHAVLTPHLNSEFSEVARAARVVVLHEFSDLNEVVQRAPLWSHTARAWSPGFTVDLPAGVPSPRTVSRWKVEAVRLSLRLRERGHLVSADFSRVGHRPGWWVDQGLLKGVRDGKQFRYQLVGREDMLPDRLWPELSLACSMTPKS